MIWLVPLAALAFLASGLALAYVIGGAAVLAFIASDNTRYLAILPQKVFSQINVFSLLAMPLHLARDDAPMPEFGPPEGADSLKTEVLEPGSGHRTRTFDYATGAEIHERFDDTGLVTHTHTGITLRAVARETFHIHPDDPNSATGTCRWEKSFARGDWHTELEAEVRVAALADVWRITATLKARDTDGVVAEREWAEDVPRDQV